jgi:hypothetical protein
MGLWGTVQIQTITGALGYNKNLLSKIGLRGLAFIFIVEFHANAPKEI